MSEKSLFLHIGMPKAGSTSIQMALTESQALCQEYDLYYPDIHWNHSKIILLMVGDCSRSTLNAYGRKYNYPIATNDAADLRSRFLAELLANDCGTHVISGETLQRLTLEQCRELRAILISIYKKIRIIAYVRHPFGWSSSRVQYSLRRYAVPVATMMRQNWLRTMKSPAIPKYKNIETFMKVFGEGNIDIRIFDRQVFEGGDLLQDFGYTIGKAELGRRLQGVWSNVSYTSEAVAILDRYVSRTPHRLMTRFQGIRSMLKDLPGSKYSLPRRDLEKIWTYSQPQVEWLHRAIGRECFHEVYPAEADRGPVWSDETVDHLERLLGIRWKNVCDSNGTVGPRGLDLLCDGFERLAPDDRLKSPLTRVGSAGLIGALRYLRSASHLLAR